MAKTKTPNVDKALAWARSVLKGRVPACRYIHQAIQRHFDDVSDSRNKSYPFKFDPAKAEKKLKLIQLLPHTKGEWAFKRQLITLEPWQAFGMAVTFGWVRKKTGFRRFRESYWEVPRKNGKSVIAAGVGISMFVADGEFGGEVYSGATTEKQAWEVFRPARLMVKRSPMLIEAAGIEVNASNMNVPAEGSRFEPLIGNPGDGASPSCAIIDEFHEHDSSAQYDTMLTGMGARRQPLMFIITTAGANIEGPCYDKRRQVIEMLSGAVPDPELFGYIWTLDEGDDWTDPKNLAKANPCMGVSVFQEYLESQLARAIRSARFTNTFKTKHLNLWVSAKAGFFNVENWKACEDKTLTLEQFEGQECILGFDLARKLDMNSMARLFWRVIDGKIHYYSVAPGFWVPEDTAYDTDNRRMAERFQKWINTGDLQVTAGAEIDYREILEEAKEANQAAPVLESPIDPHGATNLSHLLDDEGLTPVTIVQNYTNMSDPMKELEAAIESGRFHHDGNPIMTWCIGNVVGKNLPGNDDVVRPIKQGDDNKIDGAVALIMAVGRAMAKVTLGDGGMDRFMDSIRDPIFE
ncbi:terminase large subunit [Pseudomonas oryzihabitans]|uniref:Terminase n=1 Tax=Pseudomonas oryzihabitans TaxID=47885 RepID=A0ABX3IS31_9PSED|nr:terminase large subunit [Pseudomonas psychrotolerans]ONN70666.1 terminase [Pseudomonas psychrotolerans]